jgi:hypothetical protein
MSGWPGGAIAVEPDPVTGRSGARGSRRSSLVPARPRTGGAYWMVDRRTGPTHRARYQAGWRRARRRVMSSSQDVATAAGIGRDR